MRRLAWLLLLVAAPAGANPSQGAVRLFTDDAIPRYLERGQQLAKAEQWRKMVDVLQRVVIGDKQVFPDLPDEVLHAAVYSEDDVLFYPARELCLQRLAALPPEGLVAYREAWDRPARERMEAAAAETDLRAQLETRKLS